MKPAPAYEENRSALNLPFLSSALIGPLALEAVFLTLAITASPLWVIAMAVLPFTMPFLMLISLLYRNWPTGIRLDESGITFGAIGSRRAESGKRHPTVNHQSRGIFRCPWTSVMTARVATDPAEIQRLKKSPDLYTLTNRWGPARGMRHSSTGVLSSPFMRAALVIEIGPGTTYPPLRSAKFFDNFLRHRKYSFRLRPELSATWVVPTRHPEPLAATLARWQATFPAQTAGPASD
ncbi:MAG TPA: hypothetical protein VG142_01685 [Trebonia sp.]|nr:hypothetical protein [Trebonia sp.]